jgi:PKD repeat protein
MKKLITTALLAFSVLTGLAQVPPHRTCGTMDYHNYLMQTRKNYATDYAQYNQMLDQYIQNNHAALNATARTANITIPVVIHVLYNTAAQNISDAQATSQFAVLNNDFQRLNADKVNTPSTFTAVAGGVGITFCLAQRDPNGNATTGIIHKSTTTTSFTTDNKIKSSAQGGDDPWDVTRYVNIWIGNISGGILGYGEFPTSTLSNTYGLVLNYTATGTMGTAAAPYNLGRTGTHEFGHCFNLNHIWGDNGQCGNTDNCYDTPPQKGGTAAPAGCNYGTPTYPWQPNTCTRPDGIGGASMTNVNGDMFMNYMDYTDDAVMNMFSQQQCVRMLAVVSNPPYNVLASSNGCTPVTSYTLDAGITSVIKPVNGSSTCNNAVTPSVVLINAGTATLTSAKVLYKMDATATQTLNWTGSLATNASATLTLNAYTGLSAAAHTFSVWVTAPNGGVDQGSTNDSQSSTFTVTAAPVGAVLPFTEGFEAVTFPPTNWTLVNSNTLNAANTWTRVANTTGIPVTPASTAAARMDNYTGTTDITGQKNALQSPALSFVGANSSLNVRFDVSHQQYDATTSDSLNVYISTDCGGTWTFLYGKGDKKTPYLSTVTGTTGAVAFTPTVNTQWRRDSISLAAYVGQPSVYLKFESVSGWGNYVWLDNINVKYIPSSTPPVASFSVSTPKCVNSPIIFTDLSTNSPTSWVWSFPGGTPSTSTSQNPSVTYTAAGTFTATLLSANSSGTSTAVSQTIAVIAKPVVASTSTSVCAGSSATITASGASTYAWSSGATTAALSAAPTTNTSYTVIGTAASGCTNSAVGTISVTALPTVVSTSTSVCVGGTAMLMASGASTYSWSTGATTSMISVMPTANTSYTVTGTAASGCKNTAVGSVAVNALPNVTVTSATICAGSTGTLIANGASTYNWNTGATGSNLTASPTSNTNYTVIGTSAAGCNNSATATIVVGTAPVITVNSSTICAGSTATLSASGVNSYTWNTGANTSAITDNPTGTTVYTVSGNLAGCSTGASQTATVTVNALPVVSLAPISQLCVNSSAVMLMGSPSGGTYTGSGVSGSMFDPSMSGTGTFNIMYNYTDANNCSNSASQPASVSLCTGIAEAFNASAIAIYPNPAKDAIYVNLNTLSLDNTTIELYDAIGKLVVSQKVVDTISTLLISDLSKGIYSIRIITDSHQVVKRIVKE